MFGRAIRIIILIPTLTLLWGYANALGATQLVNDASGISIPTNFKIPFVDQKWAIGEKSIPRPEIVARETLREAGRQRLPEKAIKGAIATAKAAGVSAKVAKAEYEKGLAEANAEYAAANPGKTPPGAPAAAAPAPTTANFKAAYKKAQALPVKGRAPKTGYSRDQFGTAWTDTAGGPFAKNGCDTRNDILGRDLVNKTFKANTGNCKVVSGTLPYEPYLGTKDRKFDLSGGFAASLDVEHVSALGDVWQKGGQNLTKAQRTEIANDPINLMMVDPGQNRSKGDADAATWLPKNKSYRCTYISKQVDVKTKYKLWVTKAEKDAMLGVLAKC
jgi:hypothetical protein